MDIIWNPDTAIDRVVWPNCDGAINGFADKEEIISKIKNGVLPVKRTVK